MFHFGSPEDTAEILRAEALASGGPGLRECQLDELSEKELRVALAYTYMALQDAYRDDQPTEVVSILKSDYDGVFEALAEASEDFRDAVRTNRHQFAGPRTKEIVYYYKKLAGVA